jgi:chromosome segregation protein
VLAGRSPQDLVGEFPVVTLDTLLDVTTPSVTSEGFGYDPVRGELWFVGETAEAVLLELQGRRTALAAEVAALDTEVATATNAAAEAAERARVAEAAFGRAPRLRAATIDAATLSRLVDLGTALRHGIDAAHRAAGRFEAPLRARVDAGSMRASELGEELRTLGATEVNLRRELEETSAAVTAAEVEIARIDADVADATRRLDSAGEVDVAEGDDRDELVSRADRLEVRRGTLGQVNPLAREEYDAEKERLDDLKMQREDLEQSLEELEKLRAELTATVERRFAETFAAVAEHFEEVASTLFPGGEGRLRLVEAEEDGAEQGIEVELRPAGKRITRLSLLSGGEKALGAISFLFALFLARPCAFYLLDEVEAALDDTNIARFVELLRRYSDRAQFVVVTHQKRTMEAADILYGVTMGPDGVSQVVSRRLPQHQQPLAATA